MCDMQKMPARDDASCEEDEMNFTGFSTVGEGGTHFVTSGGQLPVTKLQQNVSNNGTSLSQVVGMVGGVTLPEGMQYVRTIDSGATLQSTPQFISIPIALPGTKPGDPQPTVQIQVLGPNINLQPQQQQPKYQMQIPVQGFQQGGAVLTVAYSQDGNETGGMQILGNSLPEGVQVLAAVPQEMQLIQPAQTQEKEQIQQNAQSASFQPCQHQVYVSGNHIVIAAPGDKVINNNNEMDIEIKKECDDNDDGTETSQEVPIEFDKDFAKTLSTQQKQAIEQFLRLNPMEGKKEVVIDRQPSEPLTDDEALLRIKKKKKYKKKPPKPARPKPGCVVIATAADGTAIYCCPECQMAYPAKEQLEMHLIVHKVERRFICGLCGAALKRKEHLERHKLGHNPERPFVCGVCRKGFKRREHLNLHTVIHSGVKTEMCNECGKGFYRKDHLRKHARSHESKRARDEANGTEQADLKPAIKINTAPVIPEITIRVPTTATQMPIQINIPQHVMSLASNNDGLLNSQNAQNEHNDVHSQLDALLAEHS